ncbi:MAG: lipid-binding SYLF domain-containing protein [Actinomycetota bacterium]
MRKIIAVMLGLLLAAPAWAQGFDQARTVARAADTVERLRTDENFGSRMASAISRAKALLIVPDLVKGGFIFGAEWGTGVLLVKGADGRWSGPAFYSIASGSVGLQIGVQDAAAVYVINSAGGLAAIMNNRMKLGADAGVAVAHVGAGAEASTTTNVGADIYAFSKAVGLYGGASLEGAGILPRHSWNAAYYGGNPTPEQILIDRQLDSPQADRLRDVLAR